MPSFSDHRDHVRVVTLPSGRPIEVISFADPAQALARPPERRELHDCPRCASGLVYPTDWHEAGPGRWEISLRCPSCEWRQTAVHPQADVERFDDQLDRGTDAIVADLRRLAGTNIEAEASRFAAALGSGLVLPEDF